MVEDHAFGEILWCVRNGFSLDESASFSPEERAAACIRFGMFEGGEFDWDQGDWIQPE